MNNKSHNEATKKKISEARKGQFSGNKHPMWKGGKMVVDGYMYIYNPSHPNATKMGYVCEHRLKMEKKLGRYLSKTETVHHKNHDRLDNRISNLMLCESSGKHSAKFHTKRDSAGKFSS